MEFLAGDLKRILGDVPDGKKVYLDHPDDSDMLQIDACYVDSAGDVILAIYPETEEEDDDEEGEEDS